MSVRFTQIITPKTIKDKTHSYKVPRSKIHIYKLAFSSQQKSELDRIQQSQPQRYLDILFDESNQADAHTFLKKYKLDSLSLDVLGTKWATQWSNNSTELYKHVLLQCHCGYDHRLRKSAKRRMPYDYTGCLAHVEISTERVTGHIRRIQGYLEHNTECQSATLVRIPTLPLHPSVFEIALQQLHNGATLTEVQERNRGMVEACQYRDQSNILGQYRYLLRKYDSHSLYHQFYRLQGIDLKKAPHLNIHNWLNSQSPSYNHTLSNAIFHYSPRTQKENRLEVCIATNEMKEAAWCYGHRKQILLDGTFGVCDRRLLLFVVMGVDERNHGAPLAFLLFSAPTGNEFTSSGYDTSILVKLLSEWKTSVSLHRQQEFRPVLAITDTDFKERGALLNVFPGIRLLICRFHLRQAWSNHRTKTLRGDIPGISVVRDRLRALENQLVQSTDYTLAWDVLQQERIALNQIATKPAYRAAATKGLAHVQYLSSYWMTRALWQSWSEFGRAAAAAVIGIPLEGVLSTTNHLESFNGVLKHKHLKRWSHGGRRVRVDILIYILATKIAPSIFQQRRLEDKERVMLSAALKGIPGASQLLGESQNRPIEVPVAYWESDARRDHESKALLESNRLGDPVVQQTGIQLTCWSLNSTDVYGAPLAYSIWLGYDASASCSCADFQQHGGACKHMRAAIVHTRALRDWALSHQLNVPIAYTPYIKLPADKASANQLRTYANRYVLVSHQGAASSDTNKSDSNPRTAVARAVHCINEALQGGFLGDLVDIDEKEVVDMGDDEDLHVVEYMGEGETDEDDTDDGMSSLSCDNFDEFGNNSARGHAEQLIARTAYDIKKNRKLMNLPDMHAAFDHINRRVLEVSEHRAKYEEYADELELLVTKLRGLLPAGPSAPPTRSGIQPLSQHNTATTPIPASPERRQYRKDSYSFH